MVNYVLLLRSFLKLGGGNKVAPRRPQGGTKEAPGRPQGGNGTLVDSLYEVRRIMNGVIEDLTCRWAGGQANLLLLEIILILPGGDMVF